MQGEFGDLRLDAGHVIAIKAMSKASLMQEQQVGACPVDTGCLPLGYSGNPGVN